MNMINEYASLYDWFDRQTKSFLKYPRIKIKEWFQGRYEIHTVLGYGQTSTVFEATDTLLDRTVALKIWNHVGNRVDSSVLLKEGKLLAKLDHPNIVKVYDFGVDDVTQRPWTVLEYLGNVTLYDRLGSEGRFSGQWEILLNFARQIAEIVYFLHNSANVYQLDLKPGNLALDMSSQTIKLMDLGSAYQASTDRIARYGTPGYIAPELFSDAVFTQKCDMFSLGMLIAELITGVNPLVAPQRQAINELRSYEDPWKDLERVTAAIPISRTIDFPENFQPLLDMMRNIDMVAELSEHRVPSELAELITALCAYDPSARPDAYTANRLLASFGSNEALPTPTIFISHAHADKQRFVDRLTDTLLSRGLSVWIDNQNLRTGEPFWQKIAEAIDDCDFVIVVLSFNSLKSAGVAEEIRTAQLQNLTATKILPIRIDAVEFSNIPHHFRSRQVLDFVSWDNPIEFQKKCDKLVADMMSLFSENLSAGD